MNGKPIVFYPFSHLRNATEGGENMAKTITKNEAILKQLKRAPKRGLTAAEIADRTGINLATVKAYLSAFKSEGYATVVGKVETGKRGRPALRYTAA